MIQFSDISKKAENLDEHSFLNGYDSIKSETSIDEKEAHDFWDDVFSRPIDMCQITEYDIVYEVYGRAEEEFEFEFDVSSSEIQEVFDKFRPSIWDKLSSEEKECTCKEFAIVVADKLSIEKTPSIVFYESDPCDCGSFDPVRNCIEINRNNFGDSREIVNTVTHEIRHAYQYQKTLNPETYMDLLYAYNFEHYIMPHAGEDGYANYFDYLDQLLEAEARAFANLFKLEGDSDE